jgi:hypothetical protein
MDLIVTPEVPLVIDVNPRLVEPMNAYLAGVDLIAPMLALACTGHPPRFPRDEPGSVRVKGDTRDCTADQFQSCDRSSASRRPAPDGRIREGDRGIDTNIGRSDRRASRCPRGCCDFGKPELVASFSFGCRRGPRSHCGGMAGGGCGGSKRVSEAFLKSEAQISPTGSPQNTGAATTQSRS